MLQAQFPTAAPDASLPGGVAFIVLVFLVVPVVFAAFTAWLATERGRSWGVWFVLGFFFGPVALLALGFAPRAEPSRGDSVGPPGLAGLRSRLSRVASAPRAEPPASTHDEYVPPPAPVASPVRPTARTRDRPISPLLEIDVDGAVFHEATNRAYGRGHTADGSITYFALSQERLHELSSELKVSRPVRSLIPRDDVLPIESLPPELQR